jgi:uncharacterized protein involved in exopolysaccharide biosynthesis/Mrp family chromosome partitioning ATPase
MVTIFFYLRAQAVCGVCVMNGPDRYESDLDIDIASLFVGLWRAKGRILLGSLMATALAYGFTTMVTPKYNSVAKVIIEPRESAYTRAGDQKSDDKKLFEPEAVKSQVELITSTESLRNVAEANHLSKRREFDPARDMSYLSKVLAMVGLINDPRDVLPEDRPISVMRGKLKVYTIENSRTIGIEFSSADPELAKKIPDDLAAQYVALRTQAINQSNSNAKSWLAPEIERLQKSVRGKEAKVETYRAQSGLLQGQNNLTLAKQRLSELSSELSRVQASRANAEAKAESVRAALEGGASIDSVPEIISSGLIQRLRERQVQLKSEIADLSTTLLDAHPRIIGLRSQLKNLEKQIGSEGRNILNGLEAETRTAALREKSILSELNAQKAESSTAGDDEVELNSLLRDAASERDQLEQLQTQLAAASSRGNDYVPVDASVIKAEKATIPYFPKKIPIVGSAFVGSLLLLSLITMLRELFSGRALKPANSRLVHESELAPQASMAIAAQESIQATAVESEKRPDPSLMSFSPEAPPAAPAAPEPDPEHSIKAITDRLIEKGASRAIIVSPEGDEAAASAVLIVRELADRGLRSILLDLTSTGSASHPMIDGFALPGITNLLASQAQFRDIIHSDPYSGAHVIPNGTAEPSQAMRAVERLPIILNALTTAYDTVIVECGPADPKGIARLVTPGSEIIMSVINPDDASIVKSAAALQDAGYEDILLVTPVGSMPMTPEPDRSALRRA